MVTRITRTLLAPSLLATVVAGATRSAGPTDPSAVYAPRPDHLWNRVHAALLVRTGPDGKEYGHDRLEPLLWAESRYLLDGKPAERVVAALREFDRDKGELLFDDLTRRAVLQRDLWLVANWLAGAPGSNRALERALDTAIRRPGVLVFSSPAILPTANPDRRHSTSKTVTAARTSRTTSAT